MKQNKTTNTFASPPAGIVTSASNGPDLQQKQQNVFSRLNLIGSYFNGKNV